MAQVSSSSATIPTLYEQNGNLKAIREMYPPMEKVVISADTTKSVSEIAQKTTVTGDLLPEQEVFRGPMETWPIKKSQVLNKAREKVKRCREKLQAPVKHLELIEQVMPTEGKQIKKGPLRTSCQPDSPIEDVAGVYSCCFEGEETGAGNNISKEKDLKSARDKNRKYKSIFH
jgi:hypothetical protein